MNYFPTWNKKFQKKRKTIQKIKKKKKRYDFFSSKDRLRKAEKEIK